MIRPRPFAPLARLAVLLTLAAPLAASAQPMAPEMALPFDPAVRQGTLDNGLRYYIRRNTEPEGRAELRLAVDAGSVLESEDQRGLAHFLEHMAFNGTERFAEPELVRYLESRRHALRARPQRLHVVRRDRLPAPGADRLGRGASPPAWTCCASGLAASPSPTRPSNASAAWSSRSGGCGQGAGERMNREQFPVLFADSRYAERLPIGLPDVIRTAPPEALRRFYRDWYRPDLMAVVVVGDVDVDAVEAMIRERFAEPDRTPAARPSGPSTPCRATTRRCSPSRPTPRRRRPSSRSCSRRRRRAIRTVADARAELVEDLFFSVLRARLGEIQQAARLAVRLRHRRQRRRASGPSAGRSWWGSPRRARSTRRPTC